MPNLSREIAELLNELRQRVDEQSPLAVRATQAIAALEAEQPQRDWPEDLSHENGNYSRPCYVCKNEFQGHKRRIFCKVCHNATTALEAEQEPVQQACIACGKPWDGETCGQLHNGHPFPVCVPVTVAQAAAVPDAGDFWEAANNSGFIRAFWRRIEPYKADFGRELPDVVPVQFRAAFETASCLLQAQLNDYAKDYGLLLMSKTELKGENHELQAQLEAARAQCRQLFNAGQSLRQNWNLDNMLGAKTRQSVERWDEAVYEYVRQQTKEPT